MKMKTLKSFWFFSFVIGFLLVTLMYGITDASDQCAISDIDGNVYKTITIGDQAWMAKALCASRYNNGDKTPKDLSNTEWSNTKEGTYAIYPNTEDVLTDEPVEGITSDEEIVAAYGETLSSVLRQTRDLVTILVLLCGLYYGKKGVKKFLLQEIIKDKVIRIHNSNQRAREVTSDIMMSLNEDFTKNKPVSLEDVKHIKELTKKLVESTTESSSQIHTLAFLLHATVNDIQIRIKNEKQGRIKRFEQRSLSDFYSIIYNTCNRINFFASNIVDIPKSTKPVQYHDIIRLVRKNLQSSGFTTFKNFQVGLDTRLNTAIPLIFLSILQNSTNDYIFYRKFFLTIRDNLPLLYSLYANKIYLPLTLASNKNTPLGGKDLHLIKFEKNETKLGTNEGRVFYIFVYSNLNPWLSFLKDVEKEVFTDEYYDSFLTKHQKKYIEFVDKFQELGEESVEIECSSENVEAYYSLVQNDLKRKIREIKKKYR